MPTRAALVAVRITERDTDEAVIGAPLAPGRIDLSFTEACEEVVADGVDVVEWTDFTGDEIVHRHAQHGQADISMGAQLVVRESQAAVFFRDGKALDVFGPGRHT